MSYNYIFVSINSSNDIIKPLVIKLVKLNGLSKSLMLFTTITNIVRNFYKV